MKSHRPSALPGVAKFNNADAISGRSGLLRLARIVSMVTRSMAERPKFVNGINNLQTRTFSSGSCPTSAEDSLRTAIAVSQSTKPSMGQPEVVCVRRPRSGRKDQAARDVPRRRLRGSVYKSCECTCAGRPSSLDLSQNATIGRAHAKHLAAPTAGPRYKIGNRKNISTFSRLLIFNQFCLRICDISVVLCGNNQ